MWCGLWLRQQQKHNAFLRGEEVVLAQGEWMVSDTAYLLSYVLPLCGLLQGLAPNIQY